MQKLQVIFNYRRCAKELFVKIITAVLNGLYVATADFPTPPVTKAEYILAKDAFTKASSDYITGGTGSKGAYTKTRAALVVLLDKLSGYVNDFPIITQAMIDECGFTERKVKSSGTIPKQAKGLAFTRRGGNAMLTECSVVANAARYGAILVESALLPTNFIFMEGTFDFPAGTYPRIRYNMTEQRMKHWSNLVSGTKYYLYYYTTNAAGVSVISDAFMIDFTN